jgi:hypothetical protein
VNELVLTPEQERCKAVAGLHAACYDDAKTCRFCGLSSRLKASHREDCPVGRYERELGRIRAALPSAS